MENVVDLPFPGQCEADSQWGNDFLDLKGSMVLVVQFVRGAVRFDVASAEHHQVSYLVGRRFFPPGISVPAHPLLYLFQPLS